MIDYASFESPNQRFIVGGRFGEVPNETSKFVLVKNKISVKEVVLPGHMKIYTQIPFQAFDEDNIMTFVSVDCLDSDGVYRQCVALISLDFNKGTYALMGQVLTHIGLYSGMPYKVESQINSSLNKKTFFYQTPWDFSIFRRN